MKRCRFTLWLVALLLPATFPSAGATTIVAPSFARLVNSADYIVRATVKSVTSEWRTNPDNPGKRYIGTLVELEVREVISGNPPSPLVLDLVGGRIGDKELRIDGAPEFSTGEERILFIRGNGRQIIPLVGMKHGQYPVRRDPRTGTDQVMRSSGRFLYSEWEVAQPESTPSAVLARDPRARPLSSAEFATRIRATVRISDNERRN